MLLKDIISNLDKSEQNEDRSIVWDLEDMGVEVGLQLECGTHQNMNDYKLKCYWIANHYCTDTFVGYRAYFLEDKFVALSYQPARKSDEVYEWVSKEAFIKVRNYILSLQVEESVDFPEKFLDMEEDFGKGYPVQYTGQLLRKDVWLDKEMVRVKEERSFVNGEYNFHQIIVQKGNKLIETDIRNILVPWYTV